MTNANHLAYFVGACVKSLSNIWERVIVLKRTAEAYKGKRTCKPFCHEQEIWRQYVYAGSGLDAHVTLRLLHDKSEAG